MSHEVWLGIAALSVALVGHIINFGMLVIHCRRDKRKFAQMKDLDDDK